MCTFLLAWRAYVTRKEWKELSTKNLSVKKKGGK